MRYTRFLPLLFLLITPAAARAETDADAFARELDLRPFQTISIQHRQTLKTFETFSRQTLNIITGRSTLDGRPATYTVLDMAFRPQRYVGRNIVRIQAIPVREDLGEAMRIAGIIDQAEEERILREGTVSITFLRNAEVQQFLRDLAAADTRKADAVNQVQGAAATLAILSHPNFPAFTIIPPATTRPDDHIWRNLGDIAGNVPLWVEWARSQGVSPPAPLPHYDNEVISRIGAGFAFMSIAWDQQEAEAVNEQVAMLAELLPQVNPAVYPASAKRTVEFFYNRLAKLTIPGAAVYFVAFVCFLMAARSGLEWLRLWGLRLFTLAFLIHTAGIAIRWWLVEKSVGNWFEAIPIKNQFESVLFSAWFGALVGLILEMRRSRGIFGAAASFVGWLSLVALFSAPLVTGREIGGEIGQVAGVLMSYWLYLHVTMAVAAYALIAMGFMLGTWWLIRYYRNYRTLRRTPARRLSSDVAEPADPLPMVSGGGGAATVGVYQTLARMLFVPQAHPEPAATAAHASADAESRSKARFQARSESFMATLDQCNVVVLQLAFWILGVAIILGAVWADQSWGRPWGWDPKETFALVTWMVYLVIVHMRVATLHKAWWTAVLSIIGFFVMLFNWIGVNFFLVGLHSYA